VLWTGFPGAPGYTVHYRGELDTLTSHLRTFYDAVKGLFPSNVTVQVPQSGDLINSTTGGLAGTWTSAFNASVTGTAAGVYAAPAGAVVRWLTDGIVAGRRLRGRTFLVPLAATAYQTDGSLLGTTVTNIQAAAQALVTAETANLGVWHRPVGGAGGSWSPVVSADVPDRAAILRSRRD
jgi:hypothetical protein